MARLEPFFPTSHGKPRIDDPLPGNTLLANRERGRVLSDIIFINRNGLRWRDASREYGSPKTLYNRWKRQSDKGVFAGMVDGLASKAAAARTVMIDERGQAPLVRACPRKCLKVHRPATGLRPKKGEPGQHRICAT